LAPKKAIVKKRCEIQGGGQEMAVNSKNFNNDNLVLNHSETWRRQHEFA